MASPIAQAIKQICDEKNISYEAVLETVEAALAAAYRKDFGEKNQNIKVIFDPETGGTRVFDVKIVVEDMELSEEDEEEVLETKKEEPRSIKTEDSVEGEDEEPKFNPKTMIMISDAKAVKEDVEIDEEIRTELEIPGTFGRMAAQTAKQVIMQKIREAERGVIFEEFRNKEGQVLVANVQRREGRVVLFDLGRATAVMPPEDQVEHDRYLPGERIKVYVSRVALTPKGPEIVVSRTRPELIRKLFELEIPEVANGAVVLKAIAREPGSRSKIAVTTEDDSIDPIGSCIGQRGTRIQTIITELGGEKIDVIAWSEKPEVFITNALSPAKVISVSLNDEKGASVIVAADQLSLAIGRGGQNVRLAARLTGWNITVSGAEGGEAEGVEASAVASAEGDVASTEVVEEEKQSEEKKEGDSSKEE